LLEDIWRSRSTGIVSLLAGRQDTLGIWRSYLLEADLPPVAGLYVVDNSGSPAFSNLVQETAGELLARRRFSHVDIEVAEPRTSAPNEGYFTHERHLHVARLYADVLRRVHEDLVLTLEDDVEPPLNAIRILGTEIGYRTRARVGAVAAAYAMPQNPGVVCAGSLGAHTYGWGGQVAWETLTDRPIPVSCVGGGCTVWANWAMKETVAHCDWRSILGWDGMVSNMMRSQGYGIWLHGGVRCRHHIHGHRAP
jgi:hypothetical protein